jgi:co-chaperonin GroES (HSP10)
MQIFKPYIQIELRDKVKSAIIVTDSQDNKIYKDIFAVAVNDENEKGIKTGDKLFVHPMATIMPFKDGNNEIRFINEFDIIASISEE